MALEPGKPVADWKAANQKAREKGDRLPDKLTVAELVVTYADGEEFATNIRYNESVGEQTILYLMGDPGPARWLP